MPPPAAALELLPERLWGTSIAVGQSAFYPGQFIHRARPGSGGGFAVRAHTKKGSSWAFGFESFDTMQIGHRNNAIMLLPRRSASPRFPLKSLLDSHFSDIQESE